MTDVMIYLDMDGVLADFNRGVSELCHMEATPLNGKRSAKYDDQMWLAIKKVDHFYEKLELMPGAEEMFRLIYGQYGKQCEILTGIPLPQRGIVDAKQDKIDWAQRKLAKDIKINVVYRKEKLLFCAGKGSVLIDDREKSIKDWEQSGGTGILHINAENTIAVMKEKGLL